MTEHEIRIQKLNNLKLHGINPYPSQTKRTYIISDVIVNFEKLRNTVIDIAGRIRAIRVHGGSTFMDIQDESGSVQVYLKQDTLGEKEYSFWIEHLNCGDFISVNGTLFQTQRQEKTILISGLILLTKALRPLPEKWNGLSDVEIRYRKRYLDLLANPEVRKIFLLRSKIIQYIREFLNANNFLEVETPVLQPISGGATAKPFITHHNSLDMDLYLRIAPELYLKRLLVGGFEKVYEIGRQFRNEGIDKSHNPEFTELELYWAYIDYIQLMDFSESFFKSLITKVQKDDLVSLPDYINGWYKPWPRKKFLDLIKEAISVDLLDISYNNLLKELYKNNIDFDPESSLGDLYDLLYKEVVRKNIVEPTFVIDYPVEMKPLAKCKSDNPKLVECFQLIISGEEIINAFSELNDPVAQRLRFEEQEKLRERGNEEAQHMDEDYIEALMYGMPPAAGLGIGIDRLVRLVAGENNLKDVILFPTLRPE